MNIQEFAERVIELSPYIARGFLQDAPRYLADIEITLPQFMALEYLSRHSKSTMNNLARHLMITPAATTGLVDRLIAQELVIRSNDTSDRRIIWITLSHKGRQIVSAIKKQKIDHVIRVFSKISTHDRIRYLDVLEQIVKISTADAGARKKPARTN